MAVALGGNLGASFVSNTIPAGSLVTVRCADIQDGGYYISGVTDSKGNTYTEVTPAGSDLGIYASITVTPLTSGDRVQPIPANQFNSAGSYSVDWFTGVARTAIANVYAVTLSAGAAPITSSAPVRAGDLALVATSGDQETSSPTPWIHIPYGTTYFQGAYFVNGAYLVPAATGQLTYTPSGGLNNFVQQLIVAFGAGGTSGLTMLI